MLTSIEFKAFRGFRQLALQPLQRVNLIVGKNNAGKTSLLEGISTLLNPAEAASQVGQFRQLEKQLRSQFNRTHFGSWIVHDGAKAGTALLQGNWNGGARKVELVPLANQVDLVSPKTEPSGFQRGMNPASGANNPASIHTCVIAAQHRSPEDLAESFGNAIQRNAGEELLEATLRAVDRRIKKIRIAPVQKAIQVVVDIGLSRALPISQVGQGMYRLVEVFSEIIGSEAQVAFIDEIENGIHHSSLIDLWSGIADAASRFDVQIFATTHSHECIEAAHQAYQLLPTYDFAIVQLFRETGGVQGRVLSQEQIAAAITGNIELRG